MENSEFMAMMNRWSCKWVCAAVSSLGLMSTGALAQPAPTTQVLFENVRVFDGKADCAVRTAERAGARQQDREYLRRADRGGPQ
jgi:hypothetical protein